MTHRLLAWTAIGVLVAAGCSILPKPTEEARQPKPCAVVYSVARCQAMTDLVADEIGKDRDDVLSVAIVPDAPPGGVHLSAGWHIRLRLALKDGSTHDTLICGGVVHEPACLDDPQLELHSALEGYKDVPEGSSPLPDIDLAAAEAADPILVDHLSIPIDHRGEYEIALGEGSLPNGVWTAASAEFVDGWPDDLALRDAMVLLEVRSLEPDGRPFENAYRHGWRPGVERVRAVVRFDVLWSRPGATLELRNIVVR